MKNIICNVPECGFLVDTSMACVNVTSLMALRVMLETELKSSLVPPSGINEHSLHINTVNRFLQIYIPDKESLENQFETFKAAKMLGSAPFIKQLYLQCTNPKPSPDGQHRNYYDVEC